MANKAIKYRIYPTTEQAELFAKTFGCCRKVWNLMLSDKQTHYESNHKMLQTTPAQYKSEYPYLKEVDSLALANVQLNLQKAFGDFFKKNKGFPKFKAKKRNQNSYTTNNQRDSVAILDKAIKLPKVGVVKAKIHRKPKIEWKLKSATISQNSIGAYYVSILFEYEETISNIAINKIDLDNKAIGLDFKVSCLYADSNGDFANMPKHYKSAMNKLAKEQRKLSKKQKFSKNFEKQRKKVAKVQLHTANQRKDFLHKKSNEITNHYDVICVEDISIKEQLQSRKYKHFHRSVLDNGWYDFTTMLDYKSKMKGKHFVKVDKTFPSSQRCSSCGYINPILKDDSICKWSCPSCGTHHNRDINAAINIKNEGIRLLCS